LSSIIGSQSRVDRARLNGWRFGLSAMDRPTRRAGRPATSPRRSLRRVSGVGFRIGADEGRFLLGFRLQSESLRRLAAALGFETGLGLARIAAAATRPMAPHGFWSRCLGGDEIEDRFSLGFAFAHRPRLKAADPRDRL